MVRKEGLEPPQDFSHSHLKAACLPISPLPRCYKSFTTEKYGYFIKNKASNQIFLALSLAFFWAEPPNQLAM